MLKILELTSSFERMLQCHNIITSFHNVGQNLHEAKIQWPLVAGTKLVIMINNIFYDLLKKLIEQKLVSP